MVAFLSSISANASVRLNAASPEHPDESGVTTTSYSIGGKILSYLAKTSVFKSWEFAQRESRQNAAANAAFVRAIRDGLGEHEAESARRLLGLDRQPDRVVDGLTARTVLARLGANQQQFVLKGQAIERAGRDRAARGKAPSVPPELQRTTLEAIGHNEVEADNGLPDDRPSIAEVCGLLTRKASDTDVLLMRTTLTGSSLYLESANKVAAAPELQRRATAATEYLNTCPAFKPYLGELSEGNPILRTTATVADLRRMSTSAFETELQVRYRALGPSTVSRDEVRRTPTEVSMHWISVLQEAVTTTTDESATRLISGLLKGQQTRWMSHNLTLKATAESLQRDSDVLRSAGLPDLADIAAPGSVGGSASKSKSLLGQLPTTEQGVSVTRLHDNIYGRVFESRWMANLVDNPPEEVLLTMHKIGTGMADIFDSLLEREQKSVVKRVQKQLVADPRFWFDQVPSVKQLCTAAWPESRDLLRSVLKSACTSGPQMVGMSHTIVKLYLSVNRDSSWMNKTNEAYCKISDQKGNIKERRPEDALIVPSAGITMRHQPVAVSESWMQVTSRSSLNNRPDVDRLPRTVQRGMAHGIPFSAGISGSTNIMLGIVSHLREDQGTEIDPRMALLGTIMLLNYDGGHSIHECLWMANQREPELNFQLRTSPKKREKDSSEFISNYESFQGLYAATGCWQAVTDSLSKAWTETTEYFRNNSYFAKQSPGKSAI